MKELFNTLSNISAFFAEKRFVYEAPSDRTTPAPAAAEAAPAQSAEQAKASAPKPSEVASDAKAKAEKAVGKSRADTDLLNPWPEDEKKKEPAAEVKAQVADTNGYRKSMLTEDAATYLTFMHGRYKVNLGDKDDEKNIKLGNLLNNSAKVVIVENENGGGEYAVREENGDRYFNQSTGKRVIIRNRYMIKIPESQADMDSYLENANNQKLKRLARSKKVAKEKVSKKLEGSPAAQKVFDLAYEKGVAAENIKKIAKALNIKGVQWRDKETWNTIAGLIFVDATKDPLELKDDTKFNEDLEKEKEGRIAAAIAVEKKECKEKGILFQTYDDALKAKSVVKVVMEDGETKTRPIAGRAYVNEKSDYNYATETPQENAARRMVAVQKFVEKGNLSTTAPHEIMTKIFANNNNFDLNKLEDKKVLDDAIDAYKKAQTPPATPAQTTV